MFIIILEFALIKQPISYLFYRRWKLVR